MELRKTFNEDEYNYDKALPGYPEELFDDIFRYSGVSKGSSVLEIGIGTGQATLPFLKAGCRVSAVELGDRLAEYCRRKFSSYKNFDVENSDFMEAALINAPFDLIYSATAFHWIPKESGCAKVRSLLKPGGAAALFWNHPFVGNENDETNRASMAVYKKHRPGDKMPVAFDEFVCGEMVRELKLYGFTDIEAKIYRRVRTLSSAQYVDLIRTYSDHNSLPAEVKNAFENDMKAAVDSVGGSINIYDTIDLYLAR